MSLYDRDLVRLAREHVHRAQDAGDRCVAYAYPPDGRRAERHWVRALEALIRWAHV